MYQLATPLTQHMGGKHCKQMASLYKHIGKIQRAVTLILSCKSKLFQVKFLVSTHFACRCKTYVPKCSQIPHELDYLFFSSEPIR